ncbi:transketolase [Kordiimonas sp. SCSIO 12610]|uniref:transketolase n=1 Tax=Kordiimonas sp. SCSIO 12610 TaxID=2829597 RepID=UPI002108B9FC|nr:transketolase [Kordiimonas sp. SCSIO 12610]UTW54988.1 transketolase [Kordiimonas sp. SCSIO 12610]
MSDIDFSQENDLHNDMANAIRALSMDAIQKANSGHPGMPMGMADVATVLFRNFMKFDPKNPTWANRDRFILSAGHGSMLIYSLLYLTGYEHPTIEDIKNFRQLHSPTAGHPEFGECPGVETTTGPLGQGLATSVGMAIAERLSNAEYGDTITDHYTYVLAGDGCLMEGVSQEAISLAGHLKLSKMIVLWDDNSISIDGSIDLSSSEDMGMRFEAAGWHVQAVDGHDPEAIEAAIAEAQRSDLPSMIACRTTIGYGSPNKQGTAATHGAPLGDDEIANAREFLNWPHAAFEIPENVLNEWRAVGAKGAALVSDWQAEFAKLDEFVRADFERRQNKELPSSFATSINDYKAQLVAEPVKVATRKASQMALEVINGVVPETIGGSADLTGSNLTKTSQTEGISADDFTGRYIYYGIREFEMAAAMNGLALYGSHIPYGGTFLVFTDYARPAIRLAALMKQRSIYVMTHDSIGLGEDGPTHQPVEHVASLRAMPNLNVFRPCDAVETAECWALALEAKETPSVLSLTRQGLKQQRLDHTEENLCAKGGYILHEASNGNPAVVLIATGSEVEIAAEARERLEAEGTPTRVVSMPSTELFDQQDSSYKASVLPSDALKASIEALTTYGWERYTGIDGVNIGIDTFGASAPADALYKHFGITADALIDAVKQKL